MARGVSQPVYGMPTLRPVGWASVWFSAVTGVSREVIGQPADERSKPTPSHLLDGEKEPRELFRVAVKPA